MKSNFTPKKILVSSFIFVLLASFGLQAAAAQKKPLNLGEILTGLQSKSGGFSLAEKNSFITKTVLSRGVTFKLTPLIENELRQVGASSALIRAIRRKAPGRTSSSLPTNAKARVKPEKFWIEDDVKVDGLRGVRLHAKFNVYNLKDTPVFLNVRFLDSAGKALRSSSKNFSNKLGNMAVGRSLKPKYSATVFNDTNFFIPYGEFPVRVGSHNLKVDYDLLKPDGTMIQHIELWNFAINKPVPSPNAPAATFDKLWVDYNKRRNGQLGMIVHVKFKASNMKDVSAQLALGFSRKSGDKYVNLIPNAASKNRSKSGSLTFYKDIKPAYTTAYYNDLQVFVPYSEFNLAKGSYTLQIRADLIYPSGRLLKHFAKKPFAYKK